MQHRGDLSILQLAATLLDLSTHFLALLRPHLHSIPRSLLSLPPHLSVTPKGTDAVPPPSPIIPVMTTHPRPLSAHLLAHGIDARPITWPTVPKVLSSLTRRFTLLFGVDV